MPDAHSATGVAPAKNDDGAQKPATDSFYIPLKDYWKIVKSEIQHENELIHDRMTWLIYLESMLFAGYFVAGSSTKVSDPTWLRVKHFIAFIGIAGSILSFTGIVLASKAIRFLRGSFLKQVAEQGESPDRYPEIVVRNVLNWLSLWSNRISPLGDRGRRFIWVISLRARRATLTL